ncbi:MAG: STAS domain-containing protein [Planctomycetota bacterium]|jgi:anti-anti-sigma factor
MRLTHDNHDRLTVIRLAGDMTHDALGPFKELVIKRLSEQACDFVLEADELEFIDSKGLESLLWLKEQAHEQLGQIRVVRPAEPVRRILGLTRLDHEFELADDTEQAIASLQ